MNVCYVFQEEYPWDVRAEKILASLAERGIDSHLISRNRKGLPRHEQLQPGVQVHRLPGPRSAFIRDCLNFPAFFSPVWLWCIHRLVRDVQAALIIVRDLPLAPAAIAIGRLTGTPVMMDMAENYPAMIQDTWTYRGPGVVDFVVRNPRMLKWLERRTLPHLDGVLVVSRLSAERLVALGVAPHKIFLVSNTPRLDAAGAAAPVNEHAHPGRLRLLYVGGLEESRGLEIVVRALALVAGELPGARFVIAGRGEGESAIRRLAASLGIDRRVEFTGWVSPGDVPALIRSADVCIVPHYVTEHTETTVPNKIFDYMWQERPVIATDAKALREIVTSGACGVVYRDTDPASLADALRGMMDPAVRRDLGVAGRRAVLAEYNWAKDEARLMDAVARVARTP
jgi:glycosyltransferase involved in cell wall biosynthesis